MSKENRLRADLHQVLRAALQAVEPGECVRRVLRRTSQGLEVAGQPHPLPPGRLWVVGFGKASARMAAAVEAELAELISGGLVVTADGYRAETRRVEVVEAGHPVPDARGQEAASRIVDLLSQAEEGDLVIVLISGGGSALLTSPAPGISLPDLMVTTQLLLKSGATIRELNTVRKHLSQVKGGQLARLAAPAQVFSLILSDVPGDPLDVIASGPTVPDPTTFQEAVEVLRRRGLWGAVPDMVRQRLEAGVKGLVPETPKPGDPLFQRVKNVVVGSGTTAALAACRRGEELGYRTLLLTTTLEGEAREVGRVFASLARELAASGRPLPPPALIVAAGETTVTVRGEGKGGRNQEFSLAAALGIQGLEGVVICGLGTDGRDGPTDAAGGVVDGSTVAHIQAAGLDPHKALAENDSYPALKAAGDLLVTGPTGTNVADLYLVMAGKEAR